MIEAGVAAIVAICVLVAYALAGTLGAFVAALAFLVAAVLWVRARAEPAPGPDHAAPATPRGREALPTVASLEVEVSTALASRRIYDHSMKPKLFHLAATVYSHRHAGGRAGAAAARAAAGERLWPLVDPSIKSLNEFPRVEPRELDEVITALEELL